MKKTIFGIMFVMMLGAFATSCGNAAKSTVDSVTVDTTETVVDTVAVDSAVAE